MYKNAADAACLSSSYYQQAAKISDRIDNLKARIKERPGHKEVIELTERVAVLQEEYNDLISTAETLSRQAAPPPPSPSLSARMRASR